MSMKAMRDLRDMLCDELDKIAAKRDMNPGDLETVHKLTDTIKNIDKIEILEDEGYSNSAEWRADVRGNYGRNDRRGEHYVRGHYSRDDGRESMMRKMEEIMRDATGEQREIIRRAMDELRNA